MLPSDSWVWKWKALGAPSPGRKALMTGAQLLPSGWMLHRPHMIELRRPCDSRELKMIRPSVSATGCKAMPRLRWPMHWMLPPSSSILNSCGHGGGQEHQVGAGVHQRGMGDLGPSRPALVALARGADVDDVVVVLHRPVGREVRHFHVNRLEVELLLRHLAWARLLGAGEPQAHG